MALEKEGNFLTVAPFQCAWRNDLKFRDAGRGCVAFDAFAHNDVTVVFRENVGSQHYHYKRDTSPHYTVVLGSHRNRRLKIEVAGKAVVNVEGIGLCCSDGFQSHWISVYDGLISIGKGRYPFQNLMFQWLDSNPNCTVRYVGLSSWDKHVGYGNVDVFPLEQNHMLMWKQVNSREHEKMDGEEDMEDLHSGYDYEQWGLNIFLENEELSDLVFIVGEEERRVPAHKVILQASGNFPVSPSDQDVIRLQHISYPILHAFLQFIYTGRTQVLVSQLDCLRTLSLQFQVLSLMKQCEDTIERFKLDKNLFDSGKNVELSFSNTSDSMSLGLPLKMQKLKQLQSSRLYTDVNIYIEGYGQLAHAHRIVLSLWSDPFTKMFTNGMSESISTEVYLRDVSAEVFIVMLEFMYSGELSVEDTNGFGEFLLQLLLLADQFGVVLLYQECCKILLECISEETVCPILQAVSSVPTCKLIKESCERMFAMHFDYCTTANLDFILLDETTFKNIAKHQNLTVTSEERVLDAILIWCMRAEELYSWEMLDELMVQMTPDQIFKERLLFLTELLPLVRFPLFHYHLLKKLELSNLCSQIHIFYTLVKEGICYIESGFARPGADRNYSYYTVKDRQSSYKKLQYICDGDSNGVFHFIGTSYGEHQWVNPVLAKKLTITASSPTSRHTDPKVLVSRTYQGMSFAGPRLEDGRKVAWWMVDLGQDHQLMCNYYTLRLDGLRAYIRSWNFQGSTDGRSWTNLSVHESDHMMCKPGQFGSWPITGPSALLPFRYFRVVLTGPTTDANNPWSFCICSFELYGYFR